MRKKDFSQLKTKNTTELKKQLHDRREKLWSLRVDLVSGKVKNVREIRKLKGDIARILTLLQAK